MVTCLHCLCVLTLNGTLIQWFPNQYISIIWEFVKNACTRAPPYHKSMAWTYSSQESTKSWGSGKTKITGPRRYPYGGVQMRKQLRNISQSLPLIFCCPKLIYMTHVREAGIHKEKTGSESNYPVSGIIHQLPILYSTYTVSIITLWVITPNPDASILTLVFLFLTWKHKL